MARKPTDIVQYKLRIRESLRRRIEQAAKKSGVSANQEMVGRLEASFEAETVRKLEIIAEEMANLVDRLSAVPHSEWLPSNLVDLAEHISRLSAAPPSRWLPIERPSGCSGKPTEISTPEPPKHSEANWCMDFMDGLPSAKCEGGEKEAFSEGSHQAPKQEIVGAKIRYRPRSEDRQT
jgi:hypothetical protein